MRVTFQCATDTITKAWMTRELFAEWPVEFDQDMMKQNRKVLLTLNCLAHDEHLLLTVATILFLPSNATSKIQPLDMGIIHALKVSYRQHVIQRMPIALDQAGADAPLRISLFVAVEMLKAVWIELSAEGIVNCFHKAYGPRNDVERPCDLTQVELWQRVVDVQLARRDIAWNYFVSADDNAETAEPCTDEVITREGEHCPKVKTLKKMLRTCHQLP